jgi:hypothetical protein
LKSKKLFWERQVSLDILLIALYEKKAYREGNNEDLRLEEDKKYSPFWRENKERLLQ